MRKYIFIVTLFFGFLACQKNVGTKISLDEVDQTFTDLLQEGIDRSYGNIPGLSMAVITEDLPLIWNGASGYDSDKKTDSLRVNQPFRIASVTKTFVAAAILRLHEIDSLSIHHSISKYISPEHTKLLFDGGYDPENILISHCLNHTSGLFDYAMGSSTFAEMAKKDPNKRWSRSGQLKGAMEWGSKIGEPGERYSYSDTGYILLGAIIERFYNGSLAVGLRHLLKFKTLGLESTWLETLEDPQIENPDFVHRYFRGDDVTEWDPSTDLYGGGGLVSTTQDLAKFIHTLFNNQIFEDPKTLSLMLTKPEYMDSYIIEEDRRYKDYRYGLWHNLVFGMDAYMHFGLWGVQLIHVPELNTSIAISYTKGGSERLPKKVMLVIKNLIES